jgi:hypothetical protein
VPNMVWKEPHPSHVPSLAEIAETRVIIRDADLKMVALNSQIASLKKLKSNLQTTRDNVASFIRFPYKLFKILVLSVQIASLEKRRSDLQTIRDNQASFISTFRRLPPELLEEIALYYIDEQEHRGVGVLDQVCFSLRAVVLRMKWIWQKIRIVDPDRNYFYPVSLLINFGPI